MLSFDWDAGNREKCTKHGLTISEVESVFAASPRVSPDIRHSQSEKRYLALWTVRDKPAVIVFTFRRRDGVTAIRPISARFMHAKEASRYAQTGS